MQPGFRTTDLECVHQNQTILNLLNQNLWRQALSPALADASQGILSHSTLQKPLNTETGRELLVGEAKDASFICNPEATWKLSRFLWMGSGSHQEGSHGKSRLQKKPDKPNLQHGWQERPHHAYRAFGRFFFLSGEPSSTYSLSLLYPHPISFHPKRTSSWEEAPSSLCFIDLPLGNNYSENRPSLGQPELAKICLPHSPSLKTQTNTHAKQTRPPPWWSNL